VRLPALFLLVYSSHAVLHWLVRLGSLGLLGLGVLDASLVPLPGSQDFLLIILAAHKHEFWPLYAASAWVGSVAGGYITYRIGRKGGKETLEKKIPRERLQRVYKWMEEHTFLTLFIPPLLPPPTPVSYFVLAAGAMQISRRKYFISFGSSKAIRYLLLGWLSSRYGHQIIHFMRQNYQYMLYALLALLVLGIFAFSGWAMYRRNRGEPIMPKSKNEDARPSPRAA